MKIFVTSDLHFGHRNILKLGNGRPFATIEEHDEALIENWNKVVSAGDMVFILGDLSLRCDIAIVEANLKRLKGQKHVISGNHDKNKLLASLLTTNVIASLRNYFEYTYTALDGSKQRFVMMHYPILEWNGCIANPNRNQAIHVYGHIHDTADYTNIYRQLGYKAAHIGVDTSAQFPNTSAYSPINLEDVLTYVNTIYKKETNNENI